MNLEEVGKYSLQIEILTTLNKDRTQVGFAWDPPGSIG